MSTNPIPAPEDEREQFEEWAKPCGLSLLTSGGAYVSLETVFAYAAWQARARTEASVREDGWIAVSEGLPDVTRTSDDDPFIISETCLVWPGCDKAFVATEKTTGRTNWCDELSASDLEDGDVTHWRPLPAPPVTLIETGKDRK